MRKQHEMYRDPLPICGYCRSKLASVLTLLNYRSFKLNRIYCTNPLLVTLYTVMASFYIELRLTWAWVLGARLQQWCPGPSWHGAAAGGSACLAEPSVPTAGRGWKEVQHLAGRARARSTDLDALAAAAAVEEPASLCQNSSVHLKTTCRFKIECGCARLQQARNIKACSFLLKQISLILLRIYGDKVK